MAQNNKKGLKDSNFHNNSFFLLSDLSPFAILEAYKTLRTNVIFSLPDSGCKVIVVTSGNQGEGKSTTAVNLAVAFAQNADRVLLIDCDLRMPTLAKKLQVNEKPGISNVLVGLDELEDALVRLPNGMDFLPAGEIPPNPTELLGSQRMGTLLQDLSKDYEYIILDTPPVDKMADAAILSKIASGVLIVARQDYTTHESLDAAVRKLEFAEAKILGFVFSAVKLEKTSRYDKKGYGYGYGYGYGSSKTGKTQA